MKPVADFSLLQGAPHAKQDTKMPYHNWVEVIEDRARHQANEMAFRFLPDEGGSVELSYIGLHQSARAIAASLQDRGLAGERVLMFYHGGLEFIAAFFGCLYAGVIAVPAYPPRKNRNLQRLQAVINDAHPALILSTESLLKTISPMLLETAETANMVCLATDSVPLFNAERYTRPAIGPDTLAFLQYTSGSTGAPKGVMVSHGNLIYNQEMMLAAFGTQKDDSCVGWLPLFHDMGLIGMMMHPLYAGIPCTMMSPVAFLTKPRRWLQAISDYKATRSVTPNFGFDLCVTDIAAEQRAGLDLSSLRMVLCGSEPVRKQTLDNFVAAYQPYGFREEAFYPSFGMAETTLIVSGGDVNALPVCETISSGALEEHRAVLALDGEKNQTLLSNGKALLDEKILIVNADTQIELAEGDVGEIWVGGPHIAKGYWNNQEASDRTFHAYLADTSAGPYLRTGDLGYLRKGELFVTGRIKDMMIIRGRNHYPQDVEWTVENSFETDAGVPAYLPVARSSCAVFSIEKNNEEQLIVVIEADRQYQRDLGRAQKNPQTVLAFTLQQFAAAIRKQVSNNHELQVKDIVLLKIGGLPKTSSGKVQRAACKAKYLTNELDVLWHEKAAVTAVAEAQVAAGKAIESSQIATWLIQQLSARLGVEAEFIQGNVPLVNFGLDSVQAMRVTGALEEHFKCTLPQTLMWDYETIDALAAFIAVTVNAGDAATASTASPIQPDISNRQQPFALNAIQQAYWFGQQSNELGNVSCHFYAEYQSSDLDIERLTHAWRKLITRHDMLRAVIASDGQQRILATVPEYTINVVDVSAEQRAQQFASIEAVRTEMSHQVLDSRNWPLFDIRAHKLATGKYQLHLSFDLLIADVWSLMLLFREWHGYYQSDKLTLPAIDISFRDYLLAEQALKQTPAYAESQAYWRQRILDLPAAPELPLACSPLDIKQPKFARRQARLDCKHWSALKQHAQQQGLTPSMLLCAAYAEVLGCWSKGQRFTLNLTLFNRQPIHAQVNSLVGDFTSLILLEVNQNKGQTFIERARALQQQFRQDFAHRNVNGVDVLREIGQTRGRQAANMPVVFTSAVGLTEGDDVVASWLGERVYSVSQTPQVWLDHQVVEEQGELVISWDALEQLFPENMLGDMFNAYIELLHHLLVTPAAETAWQSCSPVVLPFRQRKLRADVNNTFAEITKELLHTPFLQQAALRPKHQAVVTWDHTLSYGDLLHASSQIGHGLRKLGAKPNTLVAIVMEKGWEQVVACYGILQSGAAYVPIDPTLPQERIDYLLATTDTSVALTQSWLKNAIQWPEHVQVFAVDDEPFADELPTPLEPVQQFTDLAYIIFTSGSTGLPKGVMIDHRGAINTVLDVNERFSVSPNDRVLAISPLSFDLSVYDVFGTLAAGATLIMPNATAHSEPQHWVSIINREKVSIWNSAPAFLKIFMEYVNGETCSIATSLRLVMMSGDWIPLKLPQQLTKRCKGIKTVSLGGATEASIWSILYPIDQVDPNWKSIPYGKPMANQSFHVLDDKFENCPEWVPGQMYIGGIGLAQGYWKDAEKTARSFITHPRTGERLYRTGDLGRYFPDGNIEFLGREDFQVKIQGYRIELGEIEAALQRHPAVKDAVVSAWNPGTGEKQLVAYYVPLLAYDRVQLFQNATLKSGLETLDATIHDISAQGMRLSFLPQHWVVGQSVQIHFQFPNSNIPHDFDGRIAWKRGDEAGLKFTSDYRLTVEQSVDKLAGQAEGFIEQIARFRHTDSRRSGFRVPLAAAVKLKATNAAEVCAALQDISVSGLALQGNNLPASGETVAVHITLPDGETTLALQGKVMRRGDDSIGVHFHDQQLIGQMSQVIDYFIRQNHYWLDQSSAQILREDLVKHLPYYMVPGSFMQLTSLPVSSNGKVDRKALPEPVLGKAKKILPQTEMEQRIATIWSHVLGHEGIGVDENFFEIGGYSQLAVRLIVELRDQLNVELPIRALFEAPTIQLLAARIEHMLGTKDEGARNDIPDEQLYARYGRRGIAERIAVIRADKHYVRAEGQYLYYQEDDRMVRVLDMVCGYGSAILGHNQPDLIATAIENLQNHVPVQAQHSNNIEAGKLAKMLSDRLHGVTGRHFVATLASTGTEAIEAAIKHTKMELRDRGDKQIKYRENLTALMIDQQQKGQIDVQDGLFEAAAGLMGHATVASSLLELYQRIRSHNQRVFALEPLYLALKHAFHGMTSGALSLTASNDFRKPFHWMGIRTEWIEHNADALVDAIQRETHNTFSLDLDDEGKIGIRQRQWANIAALFIEPIQGEGGIYQIKREFVTRLRQLADNHGFPVVVDEIQCGMGRSGTFTAAEQAGLRGDYYVFSKSLGGGICKVSALMVDENRYVRDFGYVHGSTFAEDRSSCRISIKTLELFETEQVLENATRKGAIFKTKLRELKRKYPSVIKDVRGEGLMLGIEILPQTESPSFFLRTLTQHGLETLNLLIAGYLLNVKHIRIAPTKTRNTIRFLPSIYIRESEMDRVVEAFDEVCTTIVRANAGRLLRFISGSSNDWIQQPIKDWSLHHPPYSNVEPIGDERCVAHIGHVEDDETLLKADPSLGEMQAEEREAVLRTLFPFAKVAFSQRLRITAQTGETVHLSIIGLPLTGKLFEDMMRSEERELLLEKIDDGIELARANGCHTIGFGGYTSIVTLNCTAVATTGINLTSGNAFTVGMAIEGARKGAQEKNIDLATSRIAVVGAKGNIGSICARILADDTADVLLIGRNENDPVLKEIYDDILNDGWLRILREEAAKLTGVAKAMYATQTMHAFLLSGSTKTQREGKRLYDAMRPNMLAALLNELHESGNGFVSISSDMSKLKDCTVIVSATSASQPVIFAEHVSEKVQVICDIATPKDVAADVRPSWPHIQIISGGLARLPNRPGLQLMGTRLPVDHVYGCVAETTLLGITNHNGHFSFGEMHKDQVKHITRIGKQRGYIMSALKAEDVHGG